VWRNFRILILLLVLGLAAYSNLYDRLSTTDWDETLYIGGAPQRIGAAAAGIVGKDSAV
jgi:hypothetical protein